MRTPQRCGVSEDKYQMRYHEILSSLFESLDTPFPSSRISPSTWEISIPNKGSLVVSVEQRKVNNFEIAHISFNVPNPHPGQPQLTGWFQDSGATGVFAAVIKIIGQYHLDLIIFVPDDTDIEIKNKKVRLYLMMMNRMKKNNSLVRVEQIMIPTGEVLQLGFPSGSKLWNVPNSDIESLLVDFLVSKSEA